MTKPIDHDLLRKKAESYVREGMTVRDLDVALTEQTRDAIRAARKGALGSTVHDSSYDDVTKIMNEGVKLMNHYNAHGGKERRTKAEDTQQENMAKFALMGLSHVEGTKGVIVDAKEVEALRGYMVQAAKAQHKGHQI